MNTDSNYLGISAQNVEDLIKPELKEREKHNCFATPLAPPGKHTPGLFKVEIKGDKMIGLCSKSIVRKILHQNRHLASQIQYERSKQRTV